jgi:hypothetical protein
MSNDTKKYIGETISTRDANILYFIFFLNQGSLGGMVGRTLEDVGKAPKKTFKQQGHQKGHHGC